MVWYNNSINLRMGWIYEVFGGAMFVNFCFPVLKISYNIGFPNGYIDYTSAVQVFVCLKLFKLKSMQFD